VKPSLLDWVGGIVHLLLLVLLVVLDVAQGLLIRKLRASSGPPRGTGRPSVAGGGTQVQGDGPSAPPVAEFPSRGMGSSPMTLQPEQRHQLLKVATRSLEAVVLELRTTTNAVVALELDGGAELGSLTQHLSLMLQAWELELKRLDGKREVPHA
jgi:hypothetical protein